MRVRLAFAAVLVALAVACVVAGLQGAGADLHAGAHGYVNNDRPGINAHNSPSAAADPTRPTVLAVADRIDTPASSCSVSISANGGVNWQEVPVPLPAGAPNCHWPDVAWTPDGDLLVLYTALGGEQNQPVGVWLQRFTDRTPAGAPVPVVGPHAFHARLAVDGDRVLVTWVQAGPNTSARAVGFAPEPNPLVLAVSADGGRTFAAPVHLSEPERRVTVPSVVLGDDGVVVVSALDLADDVEDYEARHDARGGPPAEGTWRVVTWTSRDGGATFGPTAVVTDDLVIPQRINVDLGAPRPGLARDPASGRFYATWESGRGTARDVRLSFSDDEGATWSAPTTVAARPGTQTMPAVAVAPDGRVDVLYYDRGGDPEDYRSEVALSTSFDQGRTFTTAIISSSRFDFRIGLGSFQGLSVRGTHLDLLSEQERVVALWSDSRRGTIDDNVQDLAVALVRVEGPGALRVSLLAAGAALLGAAALVVVVARRRQARLEYWSQGMLR